ncbi:heme ABC exporter ATP-binding protein CcmA [candidate division KSB1 bacterium]|nr:heme ABC exporter ATP-binding protein CcmA [candidate division KSB1 bacterium]
MAETCALKIKNIGKRFGRTILFRDISLEMNSGDVVAITGWNGSGKSTLLRIIAGLGRATIGKIEFYRNDVLQTEFDRRHFLGLVAPELNLYDELSARENLAFLMQVRGLQKDRQAIDHLLQHVGLAGWEDALYGIYSSGMKQRLKLTQALLHSPPLLLLDEPFSNLDTKGIAVVDEIIKKHRQRGMIIIASNEQREIAYADRILNLSE